LLQERIAWPRSPTVTVILSVRGARASLRIVHTVGGNRTSAPTRYPCL